MTNPKDTGIAKLPNGLLIPEELRDALRKRDWSKPPDRAWSPDNAPTTELEQHQFSGYRVNELSLDVELWCVGKIMCIRRLSDVHRNPKVIADMHEEAFATKGTVLEVPVTLRRTIRRKLPSKRKR